MKKFCFRDIAIIELTSRVLKNGGISFTRLHILFAYYLKLIFSIPSKILQFVFYSSKIKKTVIEKDPVFILGHYRSGTTYLQKLMASDKRFGILTNFTMLFPYSNLFIEHWAKQIMQQLVNTLKIKNYFFNNDIVQLNEPAEEDHLLINKGSAYSAYWSFIFPKHFKEAMKEAQQFSDKNYCKQWKEEYLNIIQFLTFKNKGQQLLLKNPPNTGRIKYLLELFPNAKFIYIYRNPVDVFYSMKNIWCNAILKLYCLSNLSEAEIDEIILDHFAYLVDQYEKDKHMIPCENLIEVKYEELEKDPLKVIRRIYKNLNLPEFETTKSDFLLQLKKEKLYMKFKHHINKEDSKKVEQRLRKYIQQWNCKPAELIM